MSAEHIQMHFCLQSNLIKEANTQRTLTRKSSLIWFHIVFNVGYLRHKQMRDADSRSSGLGGGGGGGGGG